MKAPRLLVVMVLGCSVLILTGCDEDDGNTTRTTTTLVTTTTTTTTLPVASSTTTTTNTTVSSTTSSSTSTTFILCQVGGSSVIQYDVTFSVTNAETLGALQYEVDYSGATIEPSGTAGTVSCSRLAGDFAAFNDIESSQVLTSAFVSTGGFTGPIDVAVCTFDPRGCVETPRPEDFVITITDQSHPDFTPANATVAITRIFPPAFSTTTLP